MRRSSAGFEGCRGASTVRLAPPRRAPMPPGASLKGITPGEEDDDYSDGSRHYAACPYHIRIRERLAVTVLPRQMPLCLSLVRSLRGQRWQFGSSLQQNGAAG